MGFEDVDFLTNTHRVTEFAEKLHSEIPNNNLAQAVKLVHMMPFMWSIQLNHSPIIIFKPSDFSQVLILRSVDVLAKSNEIQIDLSALASKGARQEAILDYNDLISGTNIPKPKLVITGEDGSQVKISTFGEIEMLEEEYKIPSDKIGVKVEESDMEDRFYTFTEESVVPQMVVIGNWIN